MRPDLLIPGGSCFTHAESHAPARRQGTSRGLLREFPAASARVPMTPDDAQRRAHNF